MSSLTVSISAAPPPAPFSPISPSFSCPPVCHPSSPTPSSSNNLESTSEPGLSLFLGGDRLPVSMGDDWFHSWLGPAVGLVRVGGAKLEVGPEGGSRCFR